MTGDPHYAKGVLSDIVFTLATGEGNVKERLSEAFLPSTPIFRGDFPDHLVAQWDEIYEALLKPKQESPYRHAINGNLFGKHKKTAARYAVKIWELWRMLEYYCSEDTIGRNENTDPVFDLEHTDKSPFELFQEQEEDEKEASGGSPE